MRIGQHQGMSKTYDIEPNETTYYCYFRTLNGDLKPVNTARRNGKLVPLFPPDRLDDEPENPQIEVDAAALRQSDSRYFVNLNSIECRTWRQILAALPIGVIARNEGVSRQAIYSRLLGRGGYGGMIAKNYWVLIWCIVRGLYPPKHSRLGDGVKRADPQRQHVNGS